MPDTGAGGGHSRMQLRLQSSVGEPPAKLERFMSKRRVVVTGMGTVSPLGNDLATTWDGIVNGRSGIGPITSFDPASFTTRIAGLVKDFDITRWVNPKDARKMDEFIHYGVAASLMALEDAGLE